LPACQVDGKAQADNSGAQMAANKDRLEIRIASLASRCFDGGSVRRNFAVKISFSRMSEF